MSINALGKLALCAATSLSLSGAPADTSLLNGAEQILHNISVSTDSELSEVESICVSVEGNDGISYDYQRDLTTGTAQYSLDGGKTWLEVDENAPAEIKELHAATFETNSVNLNTEIETFDFGDDMLLMYDEATGEVLESTDGGKTWHASDVRLSVATDEDTENGETSVTVTNKDA